MKAIRQVALACLLSLQSLHMRMGNSIVVVVGTAAVVAVLVGTLAMGASLENAISGSVRSDRAIVLRHAAPSESGSSLSLIQTLGVVEAPGIARTSDDKPIASREATGVVSASSRSSGAETQVLLRGVEPTAFILRPELELVEGRMFQPGRHELIVGSIAQAQFEGFAIGEQVAVRGAPWTIVGVFEAGGSARESGLLTNVDTLLSAYQRQTYQSVSVLLQSAEAFEAFKRALTQQRELDVEAFLESEHFARMAGPTVQMWSAAAYLLAAIMAFGAMCGAANTMYSVVSSRKREIATLRAIGFKPISVLVSIVLEGLLLGLIGSLIGTALVWIAFNGNIVSGGLQLATGRIYAPWVLGWQHVLVGVVWGITVSLIGGVFPAIRAARLPVAAVFSEP